jgi:hypothetical protein
MGTARDGLASRWLSGGMALLGVLLVVPSLFLPAWQVSASDREHGSILSRQWEWSWGRVRETGIEGVELRDVWNPVALVILVALLVASLAGIAVWAFRRPAWGQVAGLVTIGLLTGRVLTTVAARVGRSLGEVDQGGSGLMVRTEMTTAGSLESAAVLVLLVALALMAVVAMGERRPESVGTEVREADTEPGPRSDARRGGVGDAPALRPAGEHLSGPIIELAEEQGG